MLMFKRNFFIASLFYLTLMAAAVFLYDKAPADSTLTTALFAATLLIGLFWGVTVLILAWSANQAKHNVPPDQAKHNVPPDLPGLWLTNVDKGRWITNVDQGHIHPDGHRADCGPGAAGAICTTCGKKMPGIWDTVCAGCGATSCYNHSTVVNQRWYCNKCMLFTLGQEPRTIGS